MTFIESICPNEFQYVGESNEPEGTTTSKSTMFQFFDSVIHNDTRTINTIIKCKFLDDCNGFIDGDMGDFFGNYFIVKTFVIVLPFI